MFLTNTRNDTPRHIYLYFRTADQRRRAQRILSRPKWQKYITLIQEDLGDKACVLGIIIKINDILSFGHAFRIPGLSFSYLTSERHPILGLSEAIDEYISHNDYENALLRLEDDSNDKEAQDIIESYEKCSGDFTHLVNNAFTEAYRNGVFTHLRDKALTETHCSDLYLNVGIINKITI